MAIGLSGSNGGVGEKTNKKTNSTRKWIVSLYKKMSIKNKD